MFVGFAFEAQTLQALGEQVKTVGWHKALQQQALVKRHAVDLRQAANGPNGFVDRECLEIHACAFAWSVFGAGSRPGARLSARTCVKLFTETGYLW